MDKGVGKNQKVSSGTFKTEIWVEELWTILKESIKGSEIPAWLRSESDAFGRRKSDTL
jgi:hypothetical protein